MATVPGTGPNKNEASKNANKAEADEPSSRVRIRIPSQRQAWWCPVITVLRKEEDQAQGHPQLHKDHKAELRLRLKQEQTKNKLQMKGVWFVAKHLGYALIVVSLSFHVHT